MKGSSLARRILVSMFLVGILPIFAMSLEDHYVGKRAIMDSEKGHLGYALNSRLDFMRAWLKHTRKEFLQTSLSDCALGKCTGEFEENGQKNAICSVLSSVDEGHAVYDSLVLYNRNWSPVVTTRNNRNNVIKQPSQAIRDLATSNHGFVSGEVYFSDLGHPILPFVQPTYSEEGNLFGYVIGHLNIVQSLGKILGDSSDIGETGRFYMLDREGRYLWTPADQQERLGTFSGLPESLYRTPEYKIIRYRDANDREVLGVSALASDHLPWILMAQVEVKEAYALHYKKVAIGILTGLLTLIVVSYFALRTSDSLAAPLKQLAQVAGNISRGNLKERAPVFKDVETKEVGEAFNSMLDRLEYSRKALVNHASLVAIGGLSSTIVHEMRNPLSSVKMNLQALEKRVQDDSVHAEMALIAVQQANRLEEMLNDLMQYGKPLKLNVDETRFKHLADSVIHAVSKAAGEKGVSVVVEDELGDRKLYVDNEKMVRALTNLVDNGIYWSPRHAAVNIAGSMTDDVPEHFSIRIIDEGPGVNLGNQEKLFNLFFSTRKEGTGIGLANVKKTVEYHGGKVTYSRNDEGRTVFTVILPVGGPKV